MAAYDIPYPVSGSPTTVIAIKRQARTSLLTRAPSPPALNKPPVQAIRQVLSVIVLWCNLSIYLIPDTKSSVLEKQSNTNHMLNL